MPEKPHPNPLPEGEGEEARTRFHPLVLRRSGAMVSMEKSIPSDTRRTPVLQQTINAMADGMSGQAIRRLPRLPEWFRFRHPM